MEKIDTALNNITPAIIKDILSFFNINTKDMLLSFIYLLLILLISYTVKKIKKPFKYYLFIKRKDSYYRYLFYRVDKIVRPILYLIYFNLFSMAISNLFNYRSSEILDIVFYIAKLILVLWIIYEIIKFFTYATLKDKIKTQKEARRELFNLILNISKIILILIFIIALLNKIGIDITALITSLGIGGAIIGFSAKDTLVNFFDSIRLVSEDAFRQGDWIETRDIEGFVTELGLASTKIRTFDNAMVTVPNSKLANDYIKNWTKRLVGRRIRFHFPIKYTTNTDEIDRVIYEIYEMIHSHPDIVNLNKIRYLKKMKQFHENGLFNIEDKYGVRSTLLVYLDEIDKYSLNILVYAFSISVVWEEWLRVKQDLIKNIIKIVEKSELEFAYPAQEIMLKNSN